MKKSLILLASLFTLGSFVPFVSAEDNPNQERIDEIEAQIKELQAELKELKGDDEAETEGDDKVVLDNESFKIAYKEVKEKDDRLEIVFEVENKSDEDYTFQAELVSIDGYMVDAANITMSDSISAGKKGKIRLRVNDYNDDGLPEVTGDLELTFRVYNNDDISDLTRYPVSVDLD